jgi:hypothetical protein
MILFFRAFFLGGEGVWGVDIYGLECSYSLTRPGSIRSVLSVKQVDLLQILLKDATKIKRVFFKSKG